MGYIWYDRIARIAPANTRQPRSVINRGLDSDDPVDLQDQLLVTHPKFMESHGVTVVVSLVLLLFSLLVLSTAVRATSLAVIVVAWPLLGFVVLAALSAAIPVVLVLNHVRARRVFDRLVDVGKDGPLPEAPTVTRPRE